VTTITTHQAKTHLSRYLAEVEGGREYIIARGKTPVAMLVPIKRSRRKPRPKVGDIRGEAFEFPVSAFAALSDEELKGWGL
jgi:antitoxin (DNA-binding transcriptional repressor) of toxin-antitoxin stability system